MVGVLCLCCSFVSCIMAMCMLLLFMKCLSSWCFVRIPSMLYCNMLMDFCLLMFCCGAGCVVVV